jgi:hypothetical protein
LDEYALDLVNLQNQIDSRLVDSIEFWACIAEGSSRTIDGLKILGAPASAGEPARLLSRTAIFIREAAAAKIALLTRLG